MTQGNASKHPEAGSSKQPVGNSSKQPESKHEDNDKSGRMSHLIERTEELLSLLSEDEHVDMTQEKITQHLDDIRSFFADMHPRQPQPKAAEAVSTRPASQKAQAQEPPRQKLAAPEAAPRKETAKKKFQCDREAGPSRVHMKNHGTPSNCCRGHAYIADIEQELRRLRRMEKNELGRVDRTNAKPAALANQLREKKKIERERREHGRGREVQQKKQRPSDYMRMRQVVESLPGNGGHGELRIGNQGHGNNAVAPLQKAAKTPCTVEKKPANLKGKTSALVDELRALRLEMQSLNQRAERMNRGR